MDSHLADGVVESFENILGGLFISVGDSEEFFTRLDSFSHLGDFFIINLFDPVFSSVVEDEVILESEINYVVASILEIGEYLF